MNVKNKIRMVDSSLKGDKSFGSQEAQEPTPMVIIILIDIFMVKFFLIISEKQLSEIIEWKIFWDNKIFS